MAKLLGGYQNGSYFVELYDDGTKIRQSKTGEKLPRFAESCDVTITKKCDGGCAFCYANCTPNGQHGELLNNPFLDTLHPYTEMAINGNDLSHPQLVEFLKILKAKKVIANITVNQKHFMQHWETLLSWQNDGLFSGLGISYNGQRDLEFIALAKKFHNAVIHTINGVLTLDDVEFLADKDLKLLILGYKALGRGVQNFEDHKEEIESNMKALDSALPKILDRFDVVSFDNLALTQLNVEFMMSPQDWEQIYMGDEGEFTFYIDLVDQTFARSSLDAESFPVMSNIDDMFRFIRNKYNFEED